MRRETTEDLEIRRENSREGLAHIGDLRLGSLFHRYRRCGKPRCACADPENEGHGVWVVSKKVGGKTVMSTVPREEQLPVVRRQLEEGQRFWKLAEDFAETNDELNRRGLVEEKAEAKAGAKKGASERPMKPRSSKRSRRS